MLGMAPVVVGCAEETKTRRPKPPQEVLAGRRAPSVVDTHALSRAAPGSAVDTSDIWKEDRMGRWHRKGSVFKSTKMPLLAGCLQETRKSDHKG